MNPDQEAHQIMTTLFQRVVEDGRRLYPNDSAAYALSVMSACLGLAMKVVMRKCSESEVDTLKTMFEHTVAVSEDMVESNG